jgi:glycosyl transferase family 2
MVDESYRFPRGDRSMNGRLELSRAAPVSKEVENLPELYVRLVKTRDNVGLQFYELIFVLDGSVNGNFAQLQELSTSEDRVRTIKFVPNVGQHAALSLALERSAGDMVIRTRFLARHL